VAVVPIPPHEKYACVCGVGGGSWPFESHVPVSDLTVDNPTSRDYGRGWAMFIFRSFRSPELSQPI
jgi:hypothetical protein